VPFHRAASPIHPPSNSSACPWCTFRRPCSHPLLSARPPRSRPRRRREDTQRPAAQETNAEPKKQKEEAKSKAAAYAAVKEAVEKTIHDREADATKKEAALRALRHDGLQRLKNEIQKRNRSIEGSGELVNPMTDELQQEVAGRLDGFLSPLVGNLVVRGFSYIRVILKPLLGSVIGAIGSIPFVGGRSSPSRRWPSRSRWISSRTR
jgi:hypothetical protein